MIIIAGVNDVYQSRPASDATTQLRAMYDRTIAAGIAVVAGTIVPYNTATDEPNDRMRAMNAWIAGEATRDGRISVVALEPELRKVADSLQSS